MFDKINILKQKGYCPDTILDIGAYHGVWTNSMRHIFKDASYFLFEAIDYQELKQFDNDDRVKVNNVLLGNKATTVNWYQKKNTGDSIFKENSHHFVDCDVIQRETIDLDTYILKSNILQDSKNIFIKIDCQGSEIPILQGSTMVLEKTDFIILEMPLFGQYNEGVANFLQHIQFMDTIGFTIYDIVDNHYINGFNMQVDVMFINKKHHFNQTVNELLLVK